MSEPDAIQQAWEKLDDVMRWNARRECWAAAGLGVLKEVEDVIAEEKAAARDLVLACLDEVHGYEYEVDVVIDEVRARLDVLTGQVASAPSPETESGG